MTPEPRNESDYSQRQTIAARRVLVDVGQVLASFVDCLVVVGGWTPDLLLPDADEPHVGSIDVDLALDAAKLNDGRYAELVKLLLDTKRYRVGEKISNWWSRWTSRTEKSLCWWRWSFLHPKRSS